MCLGRGRSVRGLIIHQILQSITISHTMNPTNTIILTLSLALLLSDDAKRRSLLEQIWRVTVLERSSSGGGGGGLTPTFTEKAALDPDPDPGMDPAAGHSSPQRSSPYRRSGLGNLAMSGSWADGQFESPQSEASVMPPPNGSSRGVISSCTGSVSRASSLGSPIQRASGLVSSSGLPPQQQPTMTRILQPVMESASSAADSVSPNALHVKSSIHLGLKYGPLTSGSGQCIPHIAPLSSPTWREGTDATFIGYHQLHDAPSGALTTLAPLHGPSFLDRPRTPSFSQRPLVSPMLSPRRIEPRDTTLMPSQRPPALATLEASSPSSSDAARTAAQLVTLQSRGIREDRMATLSPTSLPPVRVSSDRSLAVSGISESHHGCDNDHRLQPAPSSSHELITRSSLPPSRILSPRVARSGSLLDCCGPSDPSSNSNFAFAGSGHLLPASPTLAQDNDGVLSLTGKSDVVPPTVHHDRRKSDPGSMHSTSSSQSAASLNHDDMMMASLALLEGHESLGSSSARVVVVTKPTHDDHYQQSHVTTTTAEPGSHHHGASSSALGGLMRQIALMKKERSLGLRKPMTRS